MLLFPQAWPSIWYRIANVLLKLVGRINGIAGILGDRIPRRPSRQKQPFSLDASR
jgi:hypothetical protein